MSFIRTIVRLRPNKVFIRPVSTFSIPVIDFGKFRSASSPEDKKQTAKDIVSAFKESGFVYLKNHGVTPGKPSSLSFYNTQLNVFQ